MSHSLEPPPVNPEEKEKMKAAEVAMRAPQTLGISLSKQETGISSHRTPLQFSQLLGHTGFRRHRELAEALILHLRGHTSGWDDNLTQALPFRLTSLKSSCRWTGGPEQHAGSQTLLPGVLSSLGLIHTFPPDGFFIQT